MSLSKRFASSAAVAVHESSDDETTHDDELLQRLLKNKTNFSKIKPSNLCSQPCRDDLGTAGVGSDDDLTDEDLDESWKDDFNSVLKSCESRKSNSAEGNIETADKQASYESRNAVQRVTGTSSYSDKDLSVAHNEDNKLKGKSDNVRIINSTVDVPSCGIRTHSQNKKNIANKALPLGQNDGIKSLQGGYNDNGFEINHRDIKPHSSPIIKEKCISDNRDILNAKKNEKDCINSKKSGKKNNHDFRKNIDKNEIKHIYSERLNISNCGKEQANEDVKNVEKNNESKKENKGKEHNESIKENKGKEHLNLDRKVHEKQKAKHNQTPQYENETAKKDFPTMHAEDLHNKSEVSVKEAKNKNGSLDENRSCHSSQVNKKKDSKVLKPLVIKQATSFPLDELLPTPVPSKKPRASLDSSINNRESPSSARKRHKSEMAPTCQQFSAKKQRVEIVDRNITDENSLQLDHVVSDYVPAEIANILAAVDTSNSFLNLFKQKLFGEAYDRFSNDFENTRQPADSLLKPSGFYKEVTEENIAFTDTGNDVTDNSEELFHLLVQQCSELVKTEDDKSKLHSLVNLLKSESGNDFVSTGFTPDQETDRRSPPSPYSPMSTLCTEPRFEGRTLLKGGVEPRHIPKNFLLKLGKSKPRDPRLSGNYCKVKPDSIPMPKFAEEFWKTEKVKELRKRQWSINDEHKVKNRKASKNQTTHHPKEEMNAAQKNVESGQHVETKNHHIKSKTVSVQCQPVYNESASKETKAGNGQNIFSDLNNNDVIGSSSFSGIKDPSVYAAVAKVLGCKETLFEQGTQRKDTKDPHNEINPVKENTNITLVSASSHKTDLGISTIPVITGNTDSLSKTNKPSQHRANSLVHVNTSKINPPHITCIDNIVKSTTQIGIVKPMPISSLDKDTREVSMDLSSDVEEGEVTDVGENNSGNKKGRLDKGSYKQVHVDKVEPKIKASDSRFSKNFVKENSNLSDDGACSSTSSSISSSSRLSSVSSRSKRNEGTYWKRRQEYPHQRRSRYSSCSSVDSRSSERSYHYNGTGHSSRSYSKSANNKWQEKKEYARHTNKAVVSSRKHEKNKPRYINGKHSEHSERHTDHQPSHGKSRASESKYSHGQSSRSNSSNKNRSNRHDREYSNDKRCIDHKMKPKIHKTEAERTRFSSKPDTCDVDSDDPDVKRYSQDYKEKFGSKTNSQHQVNDSSSRLQTDSKSNVYSDLYKSDRDFLLNMRKKFKMADKVKHERDSVNMQHKITNTVNRKEKSTENDQSMGRHQTGKNVNKDKSSKETGNELSVSSKRSRPEADGSGCFKYSDMFTLADLENS